MLSRLRARAGLALSALVLAGSISVHGQAAFSPQAGEYSLAGAINGNQVFPYLSINASGGIVVWQDSVADGDGWGLSAQRLNNNFSGTLATFRVNEQAAGNQEHPRVALLDDGGAVFVWQGGVSPSQHVYARFMAADGTFITGDVMANTYTNYQQITPAVARTADGNVVIVWASYGQDGSMLGVYAQRFSPAGARLGGEFQVNQSTANNQRTPVVAGLADGGFVVTWVTEAARSADPNVASGDNSSVGDLYGYNIDIMGRVFDAAGAATGSEFRINEPRTDNMPRLCANPSVCGLANGSFSVAWGQKGVVTLDSAETVAENSWDIFTRAFNANGTAAHSAVMVNACVYGDQFAPRIEALGTDQMVVWTSLNQDGSREGVYGRYLNGSGELAGDEFLVNTTTANQQMHPAVASDGATRFLVVWTSYVPGTKFDLYAQRYASTQPLPQLPAPFVAALSQAKLLVAWAQLAGYNVQSYGLYIDGSATPVSVATNGYLLTGLVPGSSHTFRLDYVLSDGRRAIISAAGAGTTWGEDGNFDGLPDDWQALYWGANSANWPAAGEDSDGDGATNIQEFLAGTNPLDRDSVLRTKIAHTLQGPRLTWNAQPGFIYQVQSSTDFKTWTNLGAARFSPGASDSVSVAGGSSAAYYRVLRLRAF